MRTQEKVQMYLLDSIVNGDAIATENSKIILINSQVKGKTIIEDKGLIVEQKEIPKDFRVVTASSMTGRSESDPISIATLSPLFI